MRLGIGQDLTRIALNPKHPRKIASEAELLALRPELKQLESLIPFVPLEGCLSSKNSQQKTARHDGCADHFSSETFFLLFGC